MNEPRKKIREMTPDERREFDRIRKRELRRRKRDAGLSGTSKPRSQKVSQAAQAANLPLLGKLPQPAQLPDDIAVKIAAIQGQSNQIRLSALYQKYLKCNTKDKENAELEAWGLIEIVTKKEDENSDIISGGVRGVADWIADEWPKVTISYRMIHRWIRGEHLPAGCTENYPPSRKGFYLKSAGRPWVEKYLLNRLANDELPLQILTNSERVTAAEADMAEMKRDDMRRRMDREWMLTSWAEYTMVSIGALAKNTVRDAIEKTFMADIEQVLVQTVTNPEERAAAIAKIHAAAAGTTDAWQKTFCRKLEKLCEECQTNSEEEKKSR